MGPGRGSGGSLVAYALKITDLDPPQYNWLLFERFLNPSGCPCPTSTSTLPGQPRPVIDYVKEKYGKDAVSQIATFGTMAARPRARRGPGDGHELRALRRHRQADPGANPAPTSPGLRPDQEGRRQEHLRRGMEPDTGPNSVRKEEDVKTLLEMAQKLEGMTRNIGMHAGGVLIAPGKLTDFCPLYQQPAAKVGREPVRQGRRRAIGLVKFDFPGLAAR